MVHSSTSYVPSLPLDAPFLTCDAPFPDTCRPLQGSSMVQRLLTRALSFLDIRVRDIHVRIEVETLPHMRPYASNLTSYPYWSKTLWR